jgi:hypothetical protein
MSTHKNCFELVREVRQGLNEYSDALATGDEEGAYRNDFLITLINRATRQLFALISRRRPNEFFREAQLTGVDSVFTLPADFGKLVLFRDPDGAKVHAMAQDERRWSNQSGYQNMYYQKGRTLVLDRAGIASTYTLIYKASPRDIHQGKLAAADNALDTVTLDASRASKLADFYNGMTIEDISADWATPISAYTTGRVATVTGFDGEAGDFYGMVPEIPEWAHMLIAPLATINAKTNEISKEKASKEEIAAFTELMITTFREFATPDDDQDLEDLFSYQGPRSYGAFLI